MEIAQLPVNEKERLASLLSFNILDTDFEQEYDEIVNLASNICETPIALISLVDTRRQWFKSNLGLSVRETPRDLAFCSHAINLDDILIVNDTFDDNRFVDNPLVTGNPNIRFYAGAQLRTKEGHVLGTLCAIDRKPRKLDKSQIQALKTLSKQVVAQLELRKSYAELQKYTNYLDQQNQHKDKLFRVISHDLRSPFNSILGLSEILKKDINKLEKDELETLASSIGDTANDTFELVNNLLNWSLLQENQNGNSKTNIQIEPLVEKVLSVLAGLITKKQLVIEKKVPSGIIIYADYNVLFSAIQNFLTNAIKFTPNNGTIKVNVNSNNEKTIIIIEDSGIGISRNEIEKLMLEDNKDSKLGTSGEEGKGIGFSIAKDFIKISGGFLEMTSEPNNGSKIIITFPKRI